jgi:hypothetical protein
MVDGTRTWDRSALIEELKKRISPGRSIKFDPDRNDSSLEDAVHDEFGGWGKALTEAGLHPKTKLLNYWTEEEVVKRIRELADKEEPLNTLYLETNHPRLWNAARRFFTSIGQAVEAAGFSYGKVKKRLSWNEDIIINQIRGMYEEGEDISQISMMKKNSQLLAAAQKFYGAWSRAVEAAGIDYTNVKERHRLIKRFGSKRKNGKQDRS